MDITPDGVKITSLMEDSPAKEIGLKEGDLIIEADGHALAGLSSDEAASYLRGEEGTTLKIVIKRGTESLTFSIIRKEISVPTVVSDMLDGNIGYISISSFGENTAVEFKNELNKVDKLNPSSYIIDLRYNGGGYMDTAFAIASYFIGDNPVLNLQSRGMDPVVYYAPKSDKVINKPVIFLVNEYTASASDMSVS
jgi:carboxyl-terminal processing protease